MRKFFIFCLLAFVALCGVTSCNEDPESINNAPEVFVDEATELLRTSAVLTGRILAPAKASIKEYGFKVSSTSDFSSADTQTIPMDGELPSFSTQITNLEIGGTYFYVAYATNGLDEMTSTLKTFTTPTRSGVLLSDFRLVDEATATFSARVGDTGGGEIHGVGFCWATDDTPTTYNETVLTTINSDNTFTASLSGLEAGKTYYVRAFADSDILGDGTTQTISYSRDVLEIRLEQELPEPEPSVSVEALSATATTLNFRVTSTAVEQVRHLVISEEALSVYGEITADFVFLSNYEIEPNTTVELSASDLTPATTYYIYAAAEADEIRILSEPVRMTTEAEAVKVLPTLKVEYLEAETAQNALWFQVHCTSRDAVESHFYFVEKVIWDAALANGASMRDVIFENGFHYYNQGVYEAYFADLNSANGILSGSSALAPGTTYAGGIYVVNQEGIESEVCYLEGTTLPEERTEPASNEIWYTSTDGNIVEPSPNSSSPFDVNIVSNTYGNGKGVITFDGEVKRIGVNAFLNGGLASVTIPKSVTTIGANAFRGCGSLTSITIPESVVEIGTAAFASCESLKDICSQFSTSDNRCLILNGELNSFAPAGLTQYTIPDQVTRIGNYALAGCKLTAITIPESVVEIGNYAMGECFGLTSITIPDSVTKIGFFAFYGCSNLKDITLSKNLTAIDQHTFYNCTNLESITLDENITEIGVGAFMFCSNLKTVYCYPTTPPVASVDSAAWSSWAAFDSCSTALKIYVPNASVTAYKTAEGWSDYADRIYPMDGEEEVPETWKIYYTSTNGEIVEFSSEAQYVPVVSNLYENGKGVITLQEEITTLHYNAFRDCKTLQSITIPARVTQIEHSVFSGCENLQEVLIPEGVKLLDASAFGGCSSLRQITLPESLESILGGCFNNSGLVSITIPENVTRMDHEAFASCTALETIILSNSITSIGSQTFDNCSSLREVKMGQSINSIGQYAFKDCRALESITLPNSLLELGIGAFTECHALKQIAIPNSVSSIAEGAFKNCSQLESVTLPEKIASIEGDTFFGCGSLKSMTIPEGTMTIAPGAFYGCHAMNAITLPSTINYIGNGAFFQCEALTTITLPAELRSLEERVFDGCSNLTEIFCLATTPPTALLATDESWTLIKNFFGEIPSGLKIYVPNLSVDAYKAASGWSTYADYIYPMDGEEEIPESWKIYYTSTDGAVIAPYSGAQFGANIVSNTYENGQGVITFDGEVTQIGMNAYNYIERARCLTTITIPNSVTSIGGSAFRNCANLTTVHIPDQITEIGASAFYGCGKLLEISIPEGVSSIAAYTFYQCSSLSHASLPQHLLSIAENAFYDCSSLKNITIPEGVSTIEEKTFYRCSSLENATLPSTITTIEPQAFYECSGLTGIDIPDGVTSIGYGAFDNCSSLENISIPEGITTIEDSTFSLCTALKTISLPSTLTSIGNSAFKVCSSLQSIAIPDRVTSIGDSAFSACKTLTEVDIPYGVSSIEGYTFRACEALKRISIPESVTSIGTYAFEDCIGLESITLPASLTSIGSMAFYDCRYLSSIFCKATIPPAGAVDMFEEYYVERKIYVPSASVLAYQTAEHWNDYINIIYGYDF